jgi:DNA topoisomerase-2
MFVFVKATIENPSFNSQTKTECTSKVQSFGSKYECSEEFTKKLLKLGIMEEALALAKHKELRDLNKTDGKKQSSIRGIPKLDDANKAGTNESVKCSLLVLEGDSAKTFAVSGLSVVGRDYTGLFPLRGKMLNVRDASVAQLANNSEVNNLKKILGLQHGKKYTSLKELRYGTLEILTDADHDGSHIKGLVINFIHHFWPELIHLGFIKSMITPIIKATKGTIHNEFYTSSDYEKWKDSLKQDEIKKYTIKYYKGLGTSTAQEAKQYFKKKSMNTIFYVDNSETDKSINLAFKKDQADARKDWILEGIKNNQALEYGTENQKVFYEDFINKDLIWFSISDLKRSIPSAIDGLKPSQRKVVYACRKRNNNEIKVSQLAAYVANESSYHHGEQSLNGTIINLAQDYVGSNNMNILEPLGQFGTRLMGGKDHASPRYIFSKMSKDGLSLFHKDDDAVLKYLDDDGVSIEPEYYVPKIPLILVNGTEGIGTGYSSSVPCYNPEDIYSNIKNIISGGELKEMKPWYKGFKGTIESTSDKNDQYITRGKYVKESSSEIRITELPIGKWTQDYKEFLESLLDVHIISFNNNCSDTKIDFLVRMDSSILRKMKSDEIYKLFKLTTNLSTKNMHLFDKNNNIKKYTTPLEIIKEFAETKLVFYQLRKEHLLKKFKNIMNILENKVRFISLVTNEEIVVFKKKKEVLISELNYLNFDKIDNSYDYLLKMHIYSLTEEDMNKLEKDFKKAKQELKNTNETSVQDMWLNDLL